ncbi:hypothetical protein XELAEV_18025665mg [Xenopus laevis]|uniref:Uncharacterized protein n=1 Tax=Xenopus laevis TaxID=8355 RepID=A0A974D2R3_XENLA|nr:hypothetical protein XELAEV_18025665mg [Xenopus laevis]
MYDMACIRLQTQLRLLISCIHFVFLLLSCVLASHWHIISFAKESEYSGAAGTFAESAVIPVSLPSCPCNHHVHNCCTENNTLNP